ncbi:MAG: Uma2 family endonuclease [Candidatus Riflebacteria bacterium]|nr:Uma2 family endonuclease [Candidatus Riflebacteria bacterium]
MRNPKTAEKKADFTYADYCKWPDDERWEIIEGEAYDMTPAPNTSHQSILGDLYLQFGNFFRDKECRVFIAPFDVRLPQNNEEEDGKIRSVVQPDLVVVCDPEKIDEKGVRGAPDLAIEVVSPSSVSKDTIKKRRLYEKHGVKEFWLVHPVDRLVSIYYFGKDGSYGQPKCFDSGSVIKVKSFAGLEIDLKKVFPRIENVVRESPRKYLGRQN